jgi:hypothetical protein
MESYNVKSITCDCKGIWSTLDYNDYRIYMNQHCIFHELKEENLIYYELFNLLNYITNKCRQTYKVKYLVKILKIKKYKSTQLLKIELKHNSEINVDNFDNDKQIFIPQMNYEPMWKKIDNNTLHLIFLYDSCNHMVEKEWKPSDYYTDRKEK